MDDTEETRKLETFGNMREKEDNDNLVEAFTKLPDIINTATDNTSQLKDLSIQDVKSSHFINDETPNNLTYKVATSFKANKSKSRHR